MKKNKLVIQEDKDKENRVVYKVLDSNRLFLITHSKDVAERVFKALKLDYKKEKENASKV